jgi:acyl-CoA synthetase (AMP-forming)/AMP-acid ligase II
MTALIEAGVDKRGIVLIVLEHSIYQYPSFIAAVLRGAIPSFMAPLTTKQDPDVYRSSLEALMVRIQPVAILTSERASGSIPDTGIPILKVDNLDHANPSPVSVLIENTKTIEATETALMQHSSGTTGLKKGVMLSHHKIIEQCLTYASTIELLPGDKIASWLPLYHDMGLIACFLMPCIIGNVIISIDALEWVLRPTVLLQKITEHEANFVWLPNFAFLHILRTDLGRTTWNMRSLKALISCSEPCRSATFDAFYERYRHSGLQRGSLQVSYALAEYVFAVSHTSKASCPAAQLSQVQKWKFEMMMRKY